MWVSNLKPRVFFNLPKIFFSVSFLFLSLFLPFLFAFFYLHFFSSFICISFLFLFASFLFALFFIFHLFGCRFPFPAGFFFFFFERQLSLESQCLFPNMRPMAWHTHTRKLRLRFPKNTRVSTYFRLESQENGGEWGWVCVCEAFCGAPRAQPTLKTMVREDPSIVERGKRKGKKTLENRIERYLVFFSLPGMYYFLFSNDLEDRNFFLFFKSSWQNCIHFRKENFYLSQKNFSFVPRKFFENKEFEPLCF